MCSWNRGRAVSLEGRLWVIVTIPGSLERLLCTGYCVPHMMICSITGPDVEAELSTMKLRSMKYLSQQHKDLCLTHWPSLFLIPKKACERVLVQGHVAEKGCQPKVRGVTKDD